MKTLNEVINKVLKDHDKKMVTTSFQLEEHVHEKFSKFCAENNMSKSRFIAAIIDEILEDYNEK